MADRAEVYVDWGRLVADCPAEDCTNALEVKPGQEVYHCVANPMDGACGRTFPLDWPDDPAAMRARVAGLPSARQRWKASDEAEKERLAAEQKGGTP